MYENIHKIHATQCKMEKWQKTVPNTRQCPLDTIYPMVNLPYVLYLDSFSANVPFHVHCDTVSPLPQSEPLRVRFFLKLDARLQFSSRA